MASGSISGKCSLKGFEDEFTIRSDWTSTPNIVDNTYTVTVNHYFIVGSLSSIGISGRSDNNCTCDGISYTFTSSECYGSGTFSIGSNTFIIDHNGNFGSKTVSLSTTFNVRATIQGAGYISSITASGWIDLGELDRRVNVYQSLNSKTYDSITMNWSASNTCDYLGYNLNGEYHAIGYINASSGSYSINGLSADTRYTIYTVARRKDTQVDGVSGASDITTYKTPPSVSSVSVSDVAPFSCVAHCTASNTNVSLYEYTIIKVSDGTVIKGPYTTNVTDVTFSGLAEETTYYLRCRVKADDTGSWSSYKNSSNFTTLSDQSRGWIKRNDSWSLGKVYIKINGEWKKVKKTYIKKNGTWTISKNP